MPDNFTHEVGGLKDLGLTSTIENDCAKKMEIPNPYKISCLEFEKTDETDSLLKLAKHVFQKISKKPKVAWAPTGIQLKSWPVLHNNLNLIALATTGSGKTLSYAIPMVDSCTNLSKEVLSRQRVHGLVLAPTRELALQISKVLKAVAKSGNKLSGRKNIVSVAIYGGVDKEEQEESLVKKSSGLCSQILLSATPMRLIDLLGIGEGRLSNDRLQSLFLTTNCFVLDEADRLATQSDMTEQVDTIIDFLKSKSACLKSQSFFSATMPKRVIKKCNDWIESPRVTVRVGTVTVGKRSTESGNEDASEEDDKAGDDAGKRKKIKGPLDLSTIPAHITQTLHVCATHKKAKKLCITIKKIRDAEKADSNRRRKGLIIIFFGRIKTLNYIHALLQKEGVQGVPFHSQMFQSKRESQLNLFRSGKCPILLATDIAARGLHCKNVEYIINYDFPSSLEQYVHRCGRAGRNDVSGGRVSEKNKLNACVYSFFHRELAPMASDVVELLNSCSAWVDPNLVALIPGSSDASSTSKRKRRKKIKPSDVDQFPETKTETKQSDSDDEFESLGKKQIVLTKASHVKDNSDSELSD